MRVLLSGAAGFIGSHVVDHLLKRGDTVCGFDNFDGSYPRSVKESNMAWARTQDSYQFFEVDLLDTDELDTLLATFKPDAVIHLAAKAGVRPSIDDPRGYYRCNVEGTLNLFEACRKADVKTVVMASSSSVYGNSPKVPFCETDPVDHPISPYAASKKATELMASTWAHLFGFRVAALRFFTVYGPRQRPDLAIAKFCALISQGRTLPFYGDGSTERDYTYIDDIVQGVIASLDWLCSSPQGSYEVFNLGESQTTSLTALVQEIERALGKKAIKEYLPLQAGDVQRTYADISKARNQIGYKPRMSIEDGLAHYAAWLKDAKNP